VLTLRGDRCLHPAFPKSVVTFYYSERGTKEELDPALSEEGETFLRGVRLEPTSARLRRARPARGVRFVH